MFRLVLFILIVVLLETYAFQAIKVLSRDASGNNSRTATWIYWLSTTIIYIASLVAVWANFRHNHRGLFIFIMCLLFINVVSKLLMLLPLLVEDLYRIVRYIQDFFVGKAQEGPAMPSRKKFISGISAGLGGLTLAGFSWGIIRGAHHYKVHREEVQFTDLPEGFKGLKIGHLSDIHSGSFWDREAVKKGVRKLLNEKPDIVFFTGDLVNSVAEEMDDEMIEIFSQVKAPMGVYSILGNHDYGDYVKWPDEKPHFKLESDKSHMSPMQLANLEAIKDVHKRLGWDLLMNENRVLEKGGSSIALIGVENYGAGGRFAQYGDLKKSLVGTESIPFKLLLSHDPSHWDSEVNQSDNGIRLTFSGHTHGAQFGIETAGFRWSPIKYIYKQWAGLYGSDNSYIYVNRGFGYLGYPGRLGIRPEIGIIQLS